MSGELRERLLATFQVEAAEHLEALRGHLLALDREPAPDAARALVEEAFRAMHTLKGAARSVGLREVERVCAESEALLSALNRRGEPPDGVALARLEESVVAIDRLLALDPPEAAEPAPRQGGERTIRLGAGKLDALLVRGEELLSLKLAARDRVGEAEALAAALQGEREHARARALLASLRADRRATDAGVDGLLAEARNARMTPAATVLGLFPRMVRDLAQSDGKEVEWTARGGELEIDRRVLETIKDPLIHLVRNAVGHGIEPPELRAAAGKSRRGRVSVSVRPVEERRIEIEVADDGRGIDLAQVRQAAVRGRLLDAAGAREMSDESALGLIYRSGLTTSFVVTDVSGHGLGLAIVKERVERLEGEIAVESRLGAGTSVRMTVPAAIATFRGLLVRAGGQRYLISVEAIERVVPASRVIRWDGEVLPVARLDAVLGLPAGAEAAAPACVIVRGAGGVRAAIEVDEIAGDREVIVKELGPPLVRVRHVAGAGLLRAGTLVLILRPSDLVESVREGRLTAAEPAPEPENGGPPSVLVVDDALTTRTMQRSLLEAAGYRVAVAVDGADAWETLEREDFDLVVSDVDMPRMDGFELTTRIRADARLADLPVVLVSALETREDKERGIRVGANGYVAKSSFDRSTLLDMIRRLGVKPGGNGR